MSVRIVVRRKLVQCVSNLLLRVPLFEFAVCFPTEQQPPVMVRPRAVTVRETSVDGVAPVLEPVAGFVLIIPWALVAHSFPHVMNPLERVFRNQFQRAPPEVYVETAGIANRQLSRYRGRVSAENRADPIEDLIGAHRKRVQQIGAVGGTVVLSNLAVAFCGLLQRAARRCGIGVA